jgi:hypothetical protein
LWPAENEKSAVEGSCCLSAYASCQQYIHAFVHEDGHSLKCDILLSAKAFDLTSDWCIGTREELYRR